MNFFTTEVSDPRFENEGLRHITVKTNHLGGRGDITVFVPEGSDRVVSLPMVTLLHGVYGSHWAWAYQAGVHRTAQRMINQGTIKPMMLVMPSDGLRGDGSGYLKHKEEDFESWIVSSVPDAVRELIPQAAARSIQFIAGLSMGGYGALRLGAKYPQQYAAFSGLSSITRFEEIEPFYERGRFETFAQNVCEQESVLEILLKNRQSMEPFRFDCGTDDPLFESNKQLHNALEIHQIHHEFRENPGKHEWAYWEKYIADTLIFFNQCLVRS